MGSPSFYVKLYGGGFLIVLPIELICAHNGLSLLSTFLIAFPAVLLYILPMLFARRRKFQRHMRELKESDGESRGNE
jgi:hypothetical protein